MSGRAQTILSAVTVLALVAVSQSWADDRKEFEAHLSGFHEVHAATATTGAVGAIFSTGGGRLKLWVNKNAQEIRYRLSYEFPDAADTTVVGSQFVNQAHLHFGQNHTTGGITVWLCGSTENPGPAGTQVCPSPSGTVNGVIVPANVLAPGPTNQGLAAGDFDALVDALKAGAVYGNVHTDRFGAGEIRGQLERD